MSKAACQTHSLLLSEDELASLCGSELVPDWIVVYPEGSQPLIIFTSDPTRYAWLPDNASKDYSIARGAGQKYLISSPGLGYVKYVLGLQDVNFCW